MAAGTSRAVTVLPNGNLAVAFHGADGVLWTWAGAAGNVGTASSWAGFVMAAGTSPAITTLSNGQPAMAYQASNGDLSAEVFAFGNGTVAVGHFVDTGLAMASGTNPSITPLAGSAPVGTAFQASNGQLSTWDGTLELATLASSSTGLPMASGTSPSITGLANDRAAVAFHSSIGDELWTWTGYPGTLGMGASTGCAVTCGGLPVVSGTSPSIGAAIPAPEGLSLTARGNVVAKLRAPRTLVLLVYPRTQPAAQRKLLGRVALGQHSAGLSRITWGLRVYGHRLGAGDYVAELDARVHATLTTDGPTVSFDVGRTGKLTVIAQSNPAR